MKKNFPAFLQLLKEYIGYKSVSTDTAFATEIEQLVKWLTALFTGYGFTVEILQGPNTNPVILAELHVSDQLKTKLIYGHYDVQPASVEDGWKADPFLMREQDGVVIGRGAVDNKGQNLIHIFTAMRLIETNRLGCNLKFLLEGNEETGNADIAHLVAKYKDRLKCDTIIISDGELPGDRPTIEESLRGGGNVTLTFNSAKNDLHSGIYGSGVPSSTKELVAFLAKMLLPDGTVTIPGFYDSVDEISSKQLTKNRGLLELTNPVKDGTVATMIGKYDFNTMTGIWPAIEISGLQSGYTGVGYKNIIPANSEARINFRLVASQTPEAFKFMLEKYVADNVPNYIKYNLSFDMLYPPVKVDIASLEILEIMKHQKRIYGMEPIIKNVGGSIPIVVDFKNILGLDSILLSFGNGDCNMHGTEENFRIDLIQKGLEMSEVILS